MRVTEERAALASPGQPALVVRVPHTRHAVLVVAAGCAALQAAGGVAGMAAAAIALPLAFTLGWAADRRYLAALVLLCLPALGLTSGGGGVQPGFLPVIPLPATVHVDAFGGGLTTPLLAVAGAFLRVGVEILAVPGAARPVLPRWMGPLVVVAVVLILIGAAQGRMLGLNRWSEGVRSLFALSGLLWGFLLVRHARSAASGITDHIVTMATLGAVLFLIGLLRGHFLFLLVGLAAGLIPDALMRGARGAFWLFVAVAAAGLVGFTLTTAATVLITAAALALSTVQVGVARRILLRTSLVVGLAASVFLVWAVLMWRSGRVLELTAEAAQSQGFAHWALFKLMQDRGPLWIGAMDQIMSGPYIIVPAGRPLTLGMLGSFFPDLWEFGAHNAALELLRNTGLVAGGIGLLFMGLALVRCAGVLMYAEELRIRGLAAAVLGISLAGITTGNFPVEEVGFFLWALAGVVIGLSACRADDREAQDTASAQSGHVVRRRVLVD
jgi:hypothetical protein